jgi:alpha-beta hydrolase superfamily lysophospholipase
MNSSPFSVSEQPESGEHIWLASRDGSKHFLRLWKAPAQKASLLYLHGIEGHSLWFAETARYLQQHGITVIAMDRRGSGMSREPRGHATSWRQLFEDLLETCDYASALASNTPLFLMANCWGAKLGTLLAESGCPQSRLLSGLILSSPAIDVKVDLSLQNKLQVAWRLLCSNKKPLPIPLEITDFTNNSQFLRFIEKDEYRLDEASAQFFFNTLLLTAMSKRSAKKIKLPTLVVQSGIDTIVNIDGVKKWFEQLAANDKTFQLFAGVHHSLDFDSHPDDYRILLLNWIESHCKNNTPIQEVLANLERN